MNLWRRPQRTDWQSDPWVIPDSVDAAANGEAWRQAGSGVDRLSPELERAFCKRISDDEYFCVCKIRSSDLHGEHRVEMTIKFAEAGGEAQVVDCVVHPR